MLCVEHEWHISNLISRIFAGECQKASLENHFQQESMATNSEVTRTLKKSRQILFNLYGKTQVKYPI